MLQKEKELKEENQKNDAKDLLKKKKGIGYASDNTGQNQRWNTS